MDVIKSKDMISNNDVLRLLEEIGFEKLEKASDDTGYTITNELPGQESSRLVQNIRVYLKKNYINIYLTPAYLNLDIYVREDQTFYYHGKILADNRWFHVKSMKYKKEEDELEDFKNFLLLSICRESFLDPGKEYRGRVIGVDEIYARRKEWLL